MGVKLHVIENPNRFQTIMFPAGTKVVRTDSSALEVEITDTYEANETRRALFFELSDDARPQSLIGYSAKDVVVPGGIQISGVRVGTGPVVEFQATARVPQGYTGKVMFG